MNEKNYAPNGVIICSDKKAFLGMTHGEKPELSDDLITRLKDISKYGLWYEGNGGDIPHTEHLFGPKSNYSGGFDDKIPRVIGHPPEFLSALFSNYPPEKMVPYIVGKGTIFEAMVAAGNQISILDDSSANPISKKTVEDFLKIISNPSKRLNFLEMANEKATAINATKFIKIGAKEMWPSNWKSYPNPAGKVAKKANDYRDRYLSSLRSPNGVYVIGKGHLINIAKYGNYRIIGGSEMDK